MTVHRHLQQLLAPLLAWGGSMAAFAATRSVPAAEAWASRVAALAILAAIAVTLLIVLRRGPRLLRQRLPDLLGIASLPAVLLIAASGGFESPAAHLPAFFVMAFAARFGLAAGGVAAGSAAVLLLGAEMSAGGTSDMARAVSVLALTAAAGLIPLWLARRADREVVTAKQRLARVEGYLADRRLTPSGSSAAAGDLRPDSLAAHQDAEGIRELELLDRYLRDIRDASGADEVIFWRWNETRGTQKPASWSTENTDKPVYFSYEERAPLVKWAAEGGMQQCVAMDGVAYFVAGPVKGNGRLHGVLTVSSGAGLTHSPDGARAWMTRYAQQVALLVELLEVRRHHGRHRRQTEAVLKAARGFHAYKAPAELGKAICEAALEVTSAKRSVLVRWDAAEKSGVVQSTAGSIRVPEDMPVLATSFVGERCLQGMPVTKADARSLTAGGGVPMMNPTEASRVIGSLSVFPLAIEDEVMGAILIESDKPDQVTFAEGKNLGLLGVLAANFLEAAWRIERVKQHARTDQLTGLWNRGYFDEQLMRVLNETDRFGSPASLIIVDVDHFKAVNDNYGHPAGDAVLRQVAKTIMDGARAVDICARYGGEEVAILLPQTALQGALELAERLRKALEARLVYQAGHQIGVTASFGVASYPETVGTHEGLFPAADRALYRAKAEGRNCVRHAAAYHGGKPT